MSLKGKAAAIGIGELKPLKDPGDETPFSLMAKVSAEAIADAGLEKKDIDGFAGRHALRGSGDDLSRRRWGTPRHPNADAQRRRYRRRERRGNDLARRCRDRCGYVQRGAVPRRGSESHRRSARAGGLDAARVRGALRNDRRELRLRAHRAPPYGGVRHHARGRWRRLPSISARTR